MLSLFFFRKALNSAFSVSTTDSISYFVSAVWSYPYLICNSIWFCSSMFTLLIWASLSSAIQVQSRTR